MKLLNKNESNVLKKLLQKENLLDETTPQQALILKNIFNKVDNSLTLKRIEDLDFYELRSLVYELMRDSAEVQGMSVEDFCLTKHGLEW